MNRGPLFRLLRLERTPCPSCPRDVVYRLGNHPLHCRWCGALMVDSVAVAIGATAKLVADFGTAIAEVSKAAARAVEEMVRLTAALTRPATYVVEVETATHDDLRNGEEATGLARYSVEAYDGWEAKLVACQMAAREGRMPTRATLVANP